VFRSFLHSILPTALKRKSKIAALFLLLGLSAQVFGAEVGPEWALVDSVSFQGKIPAGDRLVISFDSITSLLQLLALEDSLTDLAEQAVEKAPDWLKADLADIFSRMDVSYQDQRAFGRKRRRPLPKRCLFGLRPGGELWCFLG
jgi:hypothetical protein